MDLFNHVYHNFYTVCSLIPTIFLVSMAFIFLTIRNKSVATWHFGLSFFFLSIFFFGYFIAATIYHPIGAYHRWFTVGSVFFIIIHITLLLFYFPDERNTLFAKIFGVALYIFAIILIGTFYYTSYYGGKVYHFLGHYWDFDIDAFSKKIGIFILLYLFIFFITGIWRTIVTKTKDRWVVLSIDLVLTIAIFIPAFLNTLSRDGLIDRGTFQVSQDLSTVIGFFIAAILYINATKDRTNFLTKILGISLATILIVFQGLSYFALQDLEKSYDSLRQKDVQLSLEKKELANNIQYMVAFSGASQKYIDTKDEKQPVSINFSDYREDYNNTILYENIRLLDERHFIENCTALLNKTSVFAKGYKNAILDYARKLPADEKNYKENILGFIDRLANTLLYERNTIIKLPADNFRERILKFYKSDDDKKNFFAEAITAFTVKSALEEEELKHEVLKFFAPMKEAGFRHYRKGSDGRFYTAFFNYDPVKEMLYEAGFSYVAYREYLHPTSYKFILMLAGLLFVISVGFQFFFLGAFVRPLKKLLDGMHLVADGDLAVTVPIAVEDELGHITRNFNVMVEKLKDSKEKLADYAQNLEKKVADRTTELQAAMEELEATNEQLVTTRDALWGEMELAKKIQTVLLPNDPGIKGYEISAHMNPADEVGGDYYDIINVRGYDWIVIGDVSGHGVPAGLIMMMVQTAIKTILFQNINLQPSELIRIINRSITANIKSLREDKYMTITVIRADEKGELIFAGLHQDIMIFRAERGTVELVETTGMWIGVMDDLTGMIEDDTFSMKGNDVMLLYSDGLTEATDSEKKMYSEERLKLCLQENGTKSPDEIKKIILNELKGYTCNDDVTIVIVKKQY